MKKIRLNRFKAFEDEITISLPDRVNLLLYGENGAGKSSIYEAIKIAFFRATLEQDFIQGTQEDTREKLAEFWGSFNNKISNNEFEIEIDDISYKVFNSASYQVFLISIDELHEKDQLNLKSLFERFYFSVDDVGKLISSYAKIEQSVNDALASFQESVSIKINEEDNYSIIVKDNKKNLERKDELKRYFNEAKLNTIVILILLNGIQQSMENDKSKILVLDDFITSLDSANRTFFVKYILKEFREAQIVILTHNISFYNLIMYAANNFEASSSKWAFYTLYEINNSHRFYVKSAIERTSKIKEDFQNLANPKSQGDIDVIGNRIRKKFEILLYEFSKLLAIGTIEDSKKILGRLTQGKPIFYSNKKTASDLIDQIEDILRAGGANNLTQQLQDKIGEFKNEGLSNLEWILRELKLYQKVTLHPMSHGAIGISQFTIKEIEMSMRLLDKLESILKDVVDGDVVTV